MTPTSRTLAYLRDEGYAAAVVEKWVTMGDPLLPGRIDAFQEVRRRVASMTVKTDAEREVVGRVLAGLDRIMPSAKSGPPGVRMDLFGCIDVVAVGKPHSGVLGLQACAGSGHAARVNKIVAIPEAKLWCECGNRLWVMSWTKKDVEGSRKKWHPRIQEIKVEDFVCENVPAPEPALPNLAELF
jgi:hypothetical protein